MPRVIRETLISVRDLVLSWGPFLLIGLGLLVTAYLLLDPAPPKRVVLATGPEQSAYAAFGKRYQAELQRYGIRVELRQTLGSRENLRLLRDEKQHVDMAFVQGGSSEATRPVDEDKSGVPLASLGSLTYEPVWIFYRAEAAKRLNKDSALRQIADLRGWRVNTGVRGSGSPGVFAKLLGANHVEREELKRTNLEETPAVIALLGNELDALVLVSAPESQIVQMLLQTPGIRLYEFTQAEAYARHYPFFTPVTLPRGVADLARDVPSRDVPLIATTTSLVTRENTHPALIQLFVQAASRIHGGAGWIAQAGQFPTPRHSEFAIAREAERFYRTGPPFLQRYLPFSLANLIDRMWVALFSIVAVLIPLARLVPPLYQFRVRSRIFRWYRILRQIEDKMERKAESTRDLLADLDKLDARAARVAVPLGYADELYALRSHIDLVRERLQQKAAAA
ncbi:MAG TPA: TAXI family TRAP transporter solute-binding subunit [Burkholderiales bacterium]|nr:TAXI family TRAP transporter solute-binding subunit [Burkholderiales bacterium]